MATARRILSLCCLAVGATKWVTVGTVAVSPHQFPSMDKPELAAPIDITKFFEAFYKQGGPHDFFWETIDHFVVWPSGEMESKTENRHLYLSHSVTRQGTIEPKLVDHMYTVAIARGSLRSVGDSEVYFLEVFVFHREKVALTGLILQNTEYTFPRSDDPEQKLFYDYDAKNWHIHQASLSANTMKCITQLYNIEAESASMSLIEAGSAKLGSAKLDQKNWISNTGAAKPEQQNRVRGPENRVRGPENRVRGPENPISHLDTYVPSNTLVRTPARPVAMVRTPPRPVATVCLKGKERIVKEMENWAEELGEVKVTYNPKMLGDRVVVNRGNLSKEWASEKFCDAPFLEIIVFDDKNVTTREILFVGEWEDNY